MTCNDAIEIWNSLRVAMSSPIAWGMLSFFGCVVIVLFSKSCERTTLQFLKGTDVR